MISISYLSKCSNGLIYQVRFLSRINSFKHSLLQKKETTIKPLHAEPPAATSSYGNFDSLGLVPELVTGLTSQGWSDNLLSSTCNSFLSFITFI